MWSTIKMATAREDEILTGEKTVQVSQPKKHDQKEAVHLDKVTDYVEEQEISGGDVGNVRKLLHMYCLLD